MKGYKLLKIPFVSKKKRALTLGLKTNGAKYSYKGYAYYIIDDKSKCIVWERAILVESEYRPTDPSMLKTDYYNSYFIKKNIDRGKILGWSEVDKTIQLMTDEQISAINDLSLKHLNTVLSLEGILSGSNPSGAEKNIQSAPIIIDPESDIDYVRFVNAIKKIRCHDKSLNSVFKTHLKHISDIEKFFTEKITIDELINENVTFGKWIKIINSDLSSVQNDDEIQEYLNMVKKSDVKNSIENIIAMNKYNLINEKKTIEKLRREFRVSLLKEAIENHYAEYTGKSDISIFDAEAAHILGVKEIRENDLDLKWIANPNNGLLLNPTLHTILDKNKMYLNEKGEFISLDESYGEGKYSELINDVMNNERVNFIKLRNKYLD